MCQCVEFINNKKRNHSICIWLLLNNLAGFTWHLATPCLFNDRPALTNGLLSVCQRSRSGYPFPTVILGFSAITNGLTYEPFKVVYYWE